MEQMSVSLIFDVSQNDSIMVFKYKDEWVSEVNESGK